jgi:RNA polymerase sigma-70 factor (ECF subfamily)
MERQAEDAWRRLEEPLRHFVARRVPSPADVDDVVQDVFVRMARGISSVREEERLGGWLFQIARRVIVDHARSRARSPLAAHGEQDEPASEAERDEQHALERQIAGYLATLIDELPPPYREAITLVELEGITQRDAARRLGVGESAMKSRVQRGRAMLRRKLEACCAIALDVRGRAMACEPLESDCRCDGDDRGERSER